MLKKDKYARWAQLCLLFESTPKQEPIFFTSTNTSFNFTTPDFQSVLLTCIELETMPSKLSISIKLAGF